MSRRADFLAAIKLVLDKDSNKEVKKQTIELAQQLSDVLSEMNVKPATVEFEELKSAFSEQLAEMGKQPIVFSDNTLKGITSQFANAIREGVKIGASSIDSELSDLTKRRELLLQERDALNKQSKNKTIKNALSKFNPLEATPLKVSGNLKEEAIRIREEFQDAYFELMDFIDDDGALDKQLDGYEEAVLKAQQKYVQLVRMQKTLTLNKDPLLNKQREKYENLIDGEEVEIVGNAFEELDDVFVEQKDHLQDITRELETISNKIQELQNRKIDIISDADKKNISYMLKSADDIQAAYDRISTNAGTIKKTPHTNIQVALNPDQETLSLTQLKSRYKNARDNGELWESTYPLIARYVNKFESDLRSGEISKDRLPEYQKLYDELTPIVGDVRKSLEGLLEFKPTTNGFTQKQESQENISTVLYENTELLKRLLGDREKSTFYNSKTGKYSPIKIGSENQVHRSMDDFIKAPKLYDTEIHSHNYKVAVPSILGDGNDMEAWAETIEYIKKRAIVARNEVLSFDFSSLQAEDVQNIITQYRAAASVVQKEFDDIRKNLQIGEKFGSIQDFEEALQVRLREELEKIMQQYPGVMSFHGISLNTHNGIDEKPKAHQNAIESYNTDANEAERERKANEGSAEAAERKAKAEREAADARRAELASQLDKYIEDNRNADQAESNLSERQKIYQSLVDECLITDEIQKKYDEVNKKLEARLALLKQVREHEHNIGSIPGSGLVTDEKDPKVYYEDWLKPFQSDVEKIKTSKLFAEEEIEHYNIKLAKMQEYLQSISTEALNKYIINPDEIDNAQKLNEILVKRKEILSIVSQFDTPLGSPSEYNEALKLNKTIEDRIAILQQTGGGATEYHEVAVNQKKIESYEELCEVVKRYNELVLKKKTEGQTFTDADREELNSISGRIQVTRDPIASDDIVNEINAFDATLNALGTTTPEKLAHYLGIEIPEAARVATNAVGDLNSELNKEPKLKSQTEGSSTMIGTGNVSSEELKALQDKNEQLRKEKENAEKDKSNAVERANNAEAEAEKLRNKFTGKDSEKSTAEAISIDKNELESILSRVTYNVRLEGDSQLDNSAEVLERVTSALSNIQINANVDANAPWARESTLNGVIKNLLENIKSNTTGIGSTSKKAPTKETDYKKTSKDDYTGSPYFSEKLKTQVSKIEEYRAKLATSGRLTKEMDEQIDELLNKLKAVQNGPDFSVWSEEFKKLRTDENTSKIFDDFIGKENKNLYQQLIDLKKQEYEWGIKLLRAQQGSSEENNARQELELIQEKIRNHSVIYEDTEQELKLQKMQEEHLRNINELTSKQVDADNKQRLKEEAATVKELVELYQRLGQAKAMADAESDTVLKQPFVDRANQIQGAISTKESTIDRNKYAQQLTGAQKESYKKQIVEELIDLYTKLGEVETKEDRMSTGDATTKQYRDEANALQARIDATQQLIDVNKELQTQFDAARKSSVDKVVLKTDRSDAVSGDKKFEKLAKLYEKLGKLQAQADATGNAVKQEDARQLDEAIKKEREQLVLSEAQTEELQRRLKISKQNEALRQGSVEAQNKFEKQIKDSRNKARLNSINSVNRNVQDALNEAAMIEGLSPESINRMKLLSAEMDKLQMKYAEIEAKGGVVSDKDQKDVVAQIGNVKRLSSEVGDLVAEYARLSGDNAKEIGTFNGELSGASLDEYKRQLTEAVMTATNGKAQIKGFDNATKTLSYTVKTGSNEFTNYTAAVRGSDNALVSLQGETKRTETFMESLTRKTKEISTYLISSISLYDIINRFKQGVQYVREIDSALTELKKVTDETEETYERFLDTASKTASKVGSTIKDVVSSTADWARLGYSMEEAASLAESTSVLLNVSEFSSIDDATSALVSTMQAFGYAAKDSMHVVDVMNEIGNNYAVSSDGIATALQDSASSLMAANNSYQEAVALIASANKVVQDPNSVGAALRTISLRLRGTSASDLESEGEDTTGAITSKSKLRGKIKLLSGVDILTDTGAYKSTYKILLEISRVWRDMSDIDQAALLEIIAGKFCQCVWKHAHRTHLNPVIPKALLLQYG